MRRVFCGRENVYRHPELKFFSDLAYFTINGIQTVGITDIVLYKSTHNFQQLDFILGFLCPMRRRNIIEPKSVDVTIHSDIYGPIILH